MVRRYITTIALIAFVGAPAAAAEKPKLAIHVAKAITCAGEPIVNATILVADGKIQAIGPRAKVTVPAGYTEIDQGDKFAMPGLIDAHSHIGGSDRDINEMVYQTNPELRVLDIIRPNNDSLKTAVAGDQHDRSPARDGRADCERQSRAHGAHATRREEPLVRGQLERLGGPHLVLAHVCNVCRRGLA